MAQGKTRALRQVIRGVLEKNGIDKEIASVLEFQLSAAIVQHLASKEKPLAEGRERHLDLLERLGETAGIAGPLMEIQAEFEAEFRRSPNWNSKDWERLCKFLLAKKKEGQTVTKFAEWFNSDEFRRKQSIFLTPERISDWWSQAFSSQAQGKFDGV